MSTVHVKKQQLFCEYVEANLSQQDTEILPSSSSSEEMETNIRKFLPRWKYLFPWVEVEDSDGEVVAKLYCRDCKAVGLKNDFALGKAHPAKGWKMSTSGGTPIQLNIHSLLHRLALLLKWIVLCLRYRKFPLQKEKP